VHEHTARLQRLEQALRAHGNAWRVPPVVEALQALRGVQFTVAVTLVAEMGDLPRFENPRALMKFLGLIPSEYSSGAQRRQGAIPKAGNTHARKALVEGAWAYRSPAQGSRPLQLRREKQPKVIQDIRWKAQVRLCKRYRQLVGRGKHATVGTVAIARELAGCMWAIATQVLVTPYVQKIPRIQPSTQQVCSRASAETQPRFGVTLGGVKRLVKDTRASREAGTRRRQGRWYPTHGEQQEQPSYLTGSDSSDARRLKNIMKT
jgi:transposase